MMNNSSILTILIVALCLPSVVSAQTVRIVNSTEQSWSGGIAGRSGANYTFVVEFSDYSEEPVPDTLWIGGDAFNLIVIDSPAIQYGNTKRTRTKKAVRYSFSAATYHDEYADRNPIMPGGEKKIPRPHPPVSYKGVALLSYKYKNRDHYYTISRIINVAEPANYP